MVLLLQVEFRAHRGADLPKRQETTVYNGRVYEL
jgi:hypothetical protein